MLLSEFHRKTSVVRPSTEGQVVFCGLVVRVLEFRAKGLGFDPWSGQGDCTFA